MTNKKRIIFGVISILMLSMIFSMVIPPLTSAHDPPLELTTHAFISANPNPVGVGQEVLIVNWLNRVMAGAPLTMIIDSIITS